MQQPVRPPPVVVLRAVSWEFGRGIAREVGGNLPPGERRGGRKEGQPDLRGFTCAEMSGKSRRSGRPHSPPWGKAVSHSPQSVPGHMIENLQGRGNAPDDIVKDLE